MNAWSQLPDYGGHGHFHTVLELSTKAGLEVAETLRLTHLQDLSLVTRIRGHGARRQPADARPEGVPRVGLGLPQPPPTTVSQALKDVSRQIQEITLELDGLRESAPRFKNLFEKRQDLHEERRNLLNQEWDAVDSVYIPTYLIELQPRLAPGVVMLYYLVEADHTDLLVVPPAGDVIAHRLETGFDALAADVSQVTSNRRQPRSRGAVVLDEASAQADDGSDAARRLYELLFAPAEKQMADAEHLLIVAEEPLRDLPFAALRRPTANGEHYLIEWKPLSLAPSAAAYGALVDLRKRQPGEAFRGRFLAFANPAYQPRGRDAAVPPIAVRSATERGFSGLAPLPGSEREVKDIRRLFDRHSLEASVLLGSEASEERFKRLAGQVTALHLAVHGFHDERQPEHSILALSLPPGTGDSPENGVLEGWEIVDQMSLDAELVALSACETGLGLGRGGEGIESLGRSFLAAGARSVLASLWRVDDTATAELMVSFYRHLLDGRAKDEALRQAQLELLRSSKLGYQAPYYWAGFQLIGDWL